ncbi:Hypothetical predicted protein, partial [Olea europaea subsp. europaea]
SVFFCFTTFPLLPRSVSGLAVLFFFCSVTVFMLAMECKYCVAVQLTAGLGRFLFVSGRVLGPSLGQCVGLCYFLFAGFLGRYLGSTGLCIFHCFLLGLEVCFGSEFLDIFWPYIDCAGVNFFGFLKAIFWASAGRSLGALFGPFLGLLSGPILLNFLDFCGRFQGLLIGPFCSVFWASLDI